MEEGLAPATGRTRQLRVLGIVLFALTLLPLFGSSRGALWVWDYLAERTEDHAESGGHPEALAQLLFAWALLAIHLMGLVALAASVAPNVRLRGVLLLAGTAVVVVLLFQSWLLVIEDMRSAARAAQRQAWAYVFTAFALSPPALSAVGTLLVQEGWSRLTGYTASAIGLVLCVAFAIQVGPDGEDRLILAMWGDFDRARDFPFLLLVLTMLALALLALSLGTSRGNPRRRARVTLILARVFLIGIVVAAAWAGIASGGSSSRVFTGIRMTLMAACFLTLVGLGFLLTLQKRRDVPRGDVRDVF